MKDENEGGLDLRLGMMYRIWAGGYVTLACYIGSKLMNVTLLVVFFLGYKFICFFCGIACN